MNEILNPTTIFSKQTSLHVSTKFRGRLCLDSFRPIVPEYFPTSSVISALNRERHFFPCIMLALEQSSTVNGKKSIYVWFQRMASRRSRDQEYTYNPLLKLVLKDFWNSSKAISFVLYP